MNKRIIPLLLCLTILIGLVPFSGVIAVSSDPDASKYSSYADYIGNVAEFNEYYPIPISNEPRNVDNPWSDNDCKFLLKEDVSNDLLLTIKSYYCSSDGSLWYMVSAAPGYELPQKLQDNPWIYQDDIFNPLGESLKINDFGGSAVFDVYGNKVNSVQLPMYGKVNLKCRSLLVDRVTYRWQVCCDKNQDLWVNLYGQIGASVTISYGMVAQRIDENGFAHIRCVSTSGDKTVVGEDIPVQIIPNSSASRLMYKTPRAVVAAENEQNTDSTAIHNVIIQYVFENGTQAANPWTATIEHGGDFKSTVKSPDVVGYTPNKTEVVLDIQDITEDLIDTVTYSPAEVDFIVSHQIQNALDDGYTEYKRISAKGYTDSMVGSNLALSDEEMAELGIYALPYDIEQKIAADSSTEIVIKYDRLYFLMNFALNGGYNVEPIYARVETPISVSEPIRAGYIFKGWDTDGDGNVDSLPATMPPHDTSIRAVWEPNPDGVNFFIAYWQENANDDNYTIAKVDKRNALAGTTYNGADTYGDMPGFHFDHADQNILIKGDGSSVVNVYYNRNRYTLTFAYSDGAKIM